MFFTIIGLGNSTINLYIVPVSSFFGFRRGDYALIFTLITGITAVVQLGYRRLEQRFGVRALLSAGAVLLPLGWLINLFSASLPAFYAGAAVIGISLGLVSLTAVSILINGWFETRHGTWLGIVAAASGLGGAFFSWVFGRVIADAGFQTAFLFTTIGLAAAALPVILLIKSPPDRPAEVIPPRPGSAEAHISPFTDRIPSERETFRNPLFWMAAAAIFLFGFAINPICVNTPAYLIEKGFDPVFSAGVYSSVLLVMGGAKIGLGIIHDRFGMRVSINLALGSAVLAPLLLIFATQTWQIWIFIVLDGLAVTVMSVIISLYAMTLLGRAVFSAYLGYLIAAVQIGISLGVPVMNYAFDLTGSYTGIAVIYTVLALVAMLVVNYSLVYQKRVSLRQA